MNTLVRLGRNLRSVVGVPQLRNDLIESALDADSVVFIEENQARSSGLTWLHVPHETCVDSDLLPRCIREDAESSLHVRLPAFHRAYHGIVSVLAVERAGSALGITAWPVEGKE